MENLVRVFVLLLFFAVTPSTALCKMRRSSSRFFMLSAFCLLLSSTLAFPLSPVDENKEGHIFQLDGKDLEIRGRRQAATGGATTTESPVDPDNAQPKPAFINPNPNPDHKTYEPLDIEQAKVKLGVPGKGELNHPDIRLLARLAVAMVQGKLYKGTQYEQDGIYTNRAVNHVDMEFPRMEELAAVIDARDTLAKQQKTGAKLDPDFDQPPAVPSGLPVPSASPTP